MPDGSNDTGMPAQPVVASVFYQTGHEPQHVPVDQIGANGAMGNGLLWVGLKEPHADLLAQIGVQLGLDHRALEEIAEPHRRPKVMEFRNMTLIVVVTVEIAGLRPVFGETQLLVGDGFLVTVRRGATASHGGLRRHLEGVPDLIARGSSYVASALLDLLADRYVAALEHFEVAVEATEQKFMLRGTTDLDIRKLYRLRRDLLRVHTAIFPVAEICRRLSRVDLTYIAPNCRAYFGEVADRVQRIDELINSLREALAFAFEAGSLMAQSQQTDTTKKLASWAAILAVPTAVAGIYGMNFEYMPELKWAFGYPLMLAATVTVCGVLYWKFKKAHWL